MEVFYMDQYSKSGGSDEDAFGSNDNITRLKASMRAMQAFSHQLLEMQTVEIGDLDSDDDKNEPTCEKSASSTDAARPKDGIRDTGLSKKETPLTTTGRDRNALPRVQTVIDVYQRSNYTTLLSVSLSDR